MELVMPFYSIEYYPREGLFGFNVRLSHDFPEITRKLKVNREGIETKAKLAWEAHGFSTKERIHPFCDWESGGLLSTVIVPGNASSLVLELEGAYSPRYTSHNFDSPKQTSIGLAIITHYFGIVQTKFFESCFDKAERIGENV